VVEAIERGQSGPTASGAMRAVRDGGSDGDGSSFIGGLATDAWRPGPPLSESLHASVSPDPAVGNEAAARDALQRAMTGGAGVLRDAASLAATASTVGEIAAALPGLARTEPGAQAHVAELANLVEVARALLLSADLRAESRGAHTRADHPGTEERFRARLVLSGAGAVVTVGAGGVAP
jgi:L-aspartate oxidase